MQALFSCPHLRVVAAATTTVATAWAQPPRSPALAEASASDSPPALAAAASASAAAALLPYPASGWDRFPTGTMTLRKAVVVHRHGDRTPISDFVRPTPSSSTSASTSTSAWTSTDSRQGFLRSDGVFWEGVVPTRDEARAWFATNPVIGPGRGGDADRWPAGQLTAAGGAQLRELGAALRARFVHETGLLPGILARSGAGSATVLARSTNFQRTRESAANLLNGLYPPGSRQRHHQHREGKGGDNYVSPETRERRRQRQRQDNDGRRQQGEGGGIGNSDSDNSAGVKGSSGGGGESGESGESGDRSSDGGGNGGGNGGTTTSGGNGSDGEDDEGVPLYIRVVARTADAIFGGPILGAHDCVRKTQLSALATAGAHHTLTPAEVALQAVLVAEMGAVRGRDGKPRATHGVNFPWLFYNEVLHCRVAHGGVAALPRGITPAMARRVGGVAALPHRFRSPELRALQVGGILGEILAFVEGPPSGAGFGAAGGLNSAPQQAQAGRARFESTGPKLATFACHDTTLLPLLGYFGMLDVLRGEWPPYASSLIIEIAELNGGNSSSESASGCSPRDGGGDSGLGRGSASSDEEDSGGGVAATAATATEKATATATATAGRLYVRVLFNGKEQVLRLNENAPGRGAMTYTEGREIGVGKEEEVGPCWMPLDDFCAIVRVDAVVSTRDTLLNARCVGR